MMTISQQNEIIRAVPEALRQQYGIVPRDYSGHQKVEKDGFVYYPELHQIVVDDAIAVYWESGKDDLQELDVDNPDNKRYLLKQAAEVLSAVMYVMVAFGENVAKIKVCFTDPKLVYRDGAEYEKIPFDGSFICYRKGDYDPENPDDLAFLKGLYVKVRYSTMQIFPWAHAHPEEWEVTWP